MHVICATRLRYARLFTRPTPKCRRDYVNSAPSTCMLTHAGGLIARARALYLRRRFARSTRDSRIRIFAHYSRLTATGRSNWQSDSFEENWKRATDNFVDVIFISPHTHASRVYARAYSRYTLDAAWRCEPRSCFTEFRLLKSGRRKVSPDDLSFSHVPLKLAQNVIYVIII